METNNSGIVTAGSSVINAYGSTDSTHNAYGTQNAPPAYETNYITHDAPFPRAPYMVDITHDAPPPYRNVTGAENPAPWVEAARRTPDSQAYRSLPQYPNRSSVGQPIPVSPQQGESHRLITNAQWRDYENVLKQRQRRRCLQVISCVFGVIVFILLLVSLVLRLSLQN